MKREPDRWTIALYVYVGAWFLVTAFAAPYGIYLIASGNTPYHPMP